MLLNVSLCQQSPREGFPDRSGRGPGTRSGRFAPEPPLSLAPGAFPWRCPAAAEHAALTREGGKARGCARAHWNGDPLAKGTYPGSCGRSFLSAINGHTEHVAPLGLGYSTLLKNAGSGIQLLGLSSQIRNYLNSLHLDFLKGKMHKLTVITYNG